jgi:hypothetical protein
MNTHYAPTEAYPLRWPDGWPKTPAADRTRGHQFKQAGGEYGKTPVTFSRARRLLLEELERLGAESAVISSSIDVRVDGVPRSGVNPDRLDFKEPGVALYFMLKGRAMVMAQDAFDNPAANLRSLGLAIEAMRSLERHGGGTMMNRAFDGFAALPPPAGVKPKRPWWQVLRYSDNPEDRELLSVGEVKARFNTLAKKMHPDAGGDSDDLSELTMARDEAVAELGVEE